MLAGYSQFALFLDYCDHPSEQIERVARVPDCFVGIVAGIVGDAAVFILLNYLPFHHPFEGRIAFYHVVIGF